MFKVKMYVLQPPVLTDTPFCKLLGYLSRGGERFVITAQQSVKSLLVSGSCEIKKKKSPSPTQMSNGKKVRLYFSFILTNDIFKVTFKGMIWKALRNKKT